MRVWLKALLLIASVQAIVSLPAAAEVMLDGKLTQGSLVRGQAPAGAKVLFNGQPVKVAKSGQFVIGIGRDAALQHQLTIIASDGSRQQLPLTFSRREYDIQRITGVAQKYVTPPAEVTERIQNDQRKVAAVRTTLSDKMAIFADPLLPAQGRISGVYGSQRIFNGEPRNPHYGLDIAAPVGAPVLAPWDGEVLLAEDLYYSGLTLIIDHGMGVTSTLMHLHRLDVTVGQLIRQGEKVAEVGATGRVTGPHLDWRINWLQERLDPQLLLSEP